MRRMRLVVIPCLIGVVVLCAAALALAVSPFGSSPSPVPDRTASASRGGLLFDGQRLRDFADVQSAPDAITEVPDPHGGGDTVLKMTVDADDVAPVTPTDNPRAQALSPSMIHAGNQFWLRTEFLIPERFPGRVPGWLTLMEVYGPPYGGSSPWQVGLNGSQMLWERNANYDYDVPWKQPIARGSWVSVLLHERFDEDGWVEMWIDGRPITFFAPGSSENRNDHAPTRRLRMETVDWSNDEGANAAKIMNYREEGMFETATVYFRELKIGTTRAAVGG